MKILDRFRVTCTQCPYQRGMQHEYDCSAPDCVPYIWVVWWRNVSSAFFWYRLQRALRKGKQ